MKKKYQALRVISTLYKIIAILCILLAILSAIGVGLATSSPISVQQVQGQIVTLPFSPLIGIVAGAGTLIAGIMIGLSLYAFANLIDLLINTEENTRLTALLLGRMVRQPKTATRSSVGVVAEE